MVDLAPSLGKDELPKLLDLLTEAVDRAPHALPSLSTLEAGDREDALAVRLQAAGVEDPWEMAAVLVAAGLDDAWLERVMACAGPTAPGAIRWLSLGLDIENLVDEIRNSAGRISELVAAMKDYSHVDKGPFERIDVHDGLESTLVILAHKLKKGVTVVRDYDRTLPEIFARGGELNQVWTNIIHNAIDAMDGEGTLTIRTGPRPRLRAGRDRRHRLRHPARTAAAHLRTLLHHQRRRSRHRPRPRHQLPHRRAAPPRGHPRPVGAG